VDSIQIQWPDGDTLVYKDIAINATIVLSKQNASPTAVASKEDYNVFEDNVLPIKYKHQDYETKDFSTEPLAPYALSNEGPHISVKDVNKDGLEDVFVPGGRFRLMWIWMEI